MEAVVAEWLRRLTRNQFPSGSAGSNPADCEIIGKHKRKAFVTSENYRGETMGRDNPLV